jgi:peptide deformylase
MSAQQGPSADRLVRLQGRPVDGYPALAPEAARGHVRRITVTGESILHKPCRPATEFGTPELEQLIDDMFLTMYVAEGAGLAANQVNVDLRLFVYDCADDDGVRHVGHILNPELELAPLKERRLLEADEGCLSVPGPRHPLFRDDRAVVHGFDRHREPVVIEGTGYFARCLLHETDHLNGIMYTDHLTRRQRSLVLEEMADVMDDVFAERRERARVFEAGDLCVARQAQALGRPTATGDI